MTKRQKVITVVVGSVIIATVVSSIIASALKKRKTIKKIYAKLDEIGTSESVGAVLDRTEKHKANLGFDPNFWKRTSGTPLPNPKLLLTSMEAREMARGIKKAMSADWFGATEDEDKIMSVIRSIPSQGVLSQVTDAYQSSPLNYGNLAEDVRIALEGSWYGSKDYLDELNAVITNKPY